MCAKTFQKLIEKHVRGHPRTHFTARKKKSFDDNFCQKKQFYQNSNKKLGPEENQKSY